MYCVEIISICLFLALGGNVEAQKCKVIPPENGRVETTAGNMDEIAVGETVTYFCNEGFQRMGTRRRKCIARRDKPILRRRAPTCQDMRPPTNPPGCQYFGKFYKPGEIIESGQSGNWCYQTICGDDGQILNADDFKCIPETTIPPPPGCTYKDKHYLVGEIIEAKKVGPMCHQKFCYGIDQIVSASQMMNDYFDCSTMITTAVTPTTPPGCIYNGKHYPLGTEIESGQDGSWCWGTVCSAGGEIIAWDDFNCMTSPTSTTACLGCTHEGQRYAVGLKNLNLNAKWRSSDKSPQVAPECS